MAKLKKKNKNKFQRYWYNNHPDWKEWVISVPSDESKFYCKFCKKEMDCRVSHIQKHSICESHLKNKQQHLSSNVEISSSPSTTLSTSCPTKVSTSPTISCPTKLSILLSVKSAEKLFKTYSQELSTSCPTKLSTLLSTSCPTKLSTSLSTSDPTKLSTSLSISCHSKLTTSVSTSCLTKLSTSLSNSCPTKMSTSHSRSVSRKCPPLVPLSSSLDPLSPPPLVLLSKLPSTSVISSSRTVSVTLPCTKVVMKNTSHPSPSYISSLKLSPLLFKNKTKVPRAKENKNALLSPTSSLTNRVKAAEDKITSFFAKNNIPLSVLEKTVNLFQDLGRDPEVLKSIKFSSLTYNSIKKELEDHEM